jgi:hypothetical protein
MAPSDAMRNRYSSDPEFRPRILSLRYGEPSPLLQEK